IKRFSVLAAHRITSTLVLGRLSGSRNLSGHYHRQTLRAMFIFVSIAATFFTTRNEIPSMQLITNSQSVIILSDQDSVAVARKPIARDTAVAELGLSARDDVPSGHKIARRDIAEGESVLKYGQVIGVASQPIP